MGRKVPVPSTFSIWPRSVEELRVLGQFHSLKGPKNIKVVKKKPQKPQWLNRLWCFLNILHRLRNLSVEFLVTSTAWQKLLLIVWGHGRQYNRLFGINTSVTCFFQQANILLAMSTICRKDCHMGKGKKNLFLKVIAHIFKKKKEKKCILILAWLPCACFLNSHRNKVAMHSERATWGKCFCENSAKNPKCKGIGVVVKKKSCCFYFSMLAGKLRTMHLHNTATNSVLINPSEQLRVHGGLLVHPKASSL